MNGTTPYSLLPRNTQFLLPLPTKAQRLIYKRNTCKTEIQKVRNKIATLQSEIAFWNDFSTHLKSEYKKTDLELSKLDGRFKVIPSPTTSPPNTQSTKPQPSTSKSAISNLTPAQLTTLTSTLEKLMEATNA